MIKCLPNFKQELPSIILISALQAWWNFNFPAIVRFGSPYNFIFSSVLTIVCIAIYVYIFSNASKYRSVYSFDFLNDVPEPLQTKLKLLGKCMAVVMALLIFGSFWFMDYYQMTNLHYAALYSFYILAFLLMYNAVHKK